MLLNMNTKIGLFCTDSVAVRAAVADVQRDLRTVCAGCDINGRNSQIMLLPNSELSDGMFRIAVDGDELHIEANDDLGFIYGLYHVSRELLGVPNFWFWMDWMPSGTGPVQVPDNYSFESQPFAVAERGWFVNDEVLLMGWQLDNNPDLPWQMVFETLLRCGGNMVIPGTGNNSVHHVAAASARGLMIAQHHAEPLGAQLFSSAYPDLNPSWDEHKDLFIGLWRESIETHRGKHVVWNVGFRGQGDSPFWNYDSAYDTDAKRGGLISSIIRIQRDMVLEADSQARCCVYLYGEVLELYRKGVLDLPDDVIKVWSDNGYGRMVTRRQGNHDPRIDAMPNAGDTGSQGIYFHASFYDLQAANHITTLPNDPALVVRELGEVLTRGGNDFWIINSSNIKPHVYYLDLIARLWRDGIDQSDHHLTSVNTDAENDVAGSVAEAFVASHDDDFATTYYGAQDAPAVVQAYKSYFDSAVRYSDGAWDKHAAEQYFNYSSRELVAQFIRNSGQSCTDLLWATGDVSLSEQIDTIDNVAKFGTQQYGTLVDAYAVAAVRMQLHARRLFEDSIALHAKIYEHCCRATHLTCESLRKGLDADWQRAFWYAGLARREFCKARKSMLSREHGRWHGFYANECLTDIAQSVWVLSGLMAYLRTMGDGPHFYQWQRDFTYSRQESKITTLLNLENHLTDDEMFDAMLVRWEDANS